MKQLLIATLAICTTSNSFSQNVGIGTSTPTKARLEVHGVAGSGNTTAIFGGSSSGVSFQQNWPTIGFNQYRDNTVGNGKFMSTGYAAIQYLDPGSGAMLFDMLGTGPIGNLTSSGNRAITILNNGNVGIRGTGSSSASLFVNKSGNFDGSAVFAGTAYWSHFNYGVPEHTYIRAGKNNGNVYINDITGGKVIVGQHNGETKFGINAGDPVTTLEVVQASNGTGMALINPDWGWQVWELRNDKYNSDPNNPQTCLELRYSGRPNYPIMGWFKPDNGDYFSNSDQRLKTGITTLEPVLQRVMQLRPTRYKIKDVPSSDEHIGLIAQEAKLLFPEMVSIHQNSERSGLPQQHGITYGAFSVVAIKAIQEQQVIIESQASKIADLEARLLYIERLLSAKK